MTITGVSANNKPFDGTTTATLSGSPSLVGVIGADVVTVTGVASATFATSAIGTGIVVTVTGYTLGGAQAGNYSVTQPTGLTANITSALPTAQATGISFTNVTNTTLRVNYAAAGDGASRLLVAKSGSAVAGNPANGVSYSPTGNFTTDTDLGGGNIVVGTITSGAAGFFDVTNLTANITYHFAIFEFNGSAGTESYLTTSPLIGSRKTADEPANHVTAFTASATATVITLNWTGATGSPAPVNYLIVARDVTNGGAFPSFTDGSAAPSDDVNLSSQSSTWNGSKIIAFGTNTFNGWTNLTTGNQYEFAIYPYTTAGTPTPDFKTSPAAPTVQVFTEPSASASNPTFSNLAPTSIDVTVGGGTGITGGYLVIRKAGSAPLGTPSDGTSYTAGVSTIGGDPVVYTGAAGLFNDTGLSSSTTYHYAVYGYSGSGTNTNYRLTSPGTANSTTLCQPPTVQATAITFGLTTASSAIVNWTRGDGNNVIILARDGAAAAVSPSNGTSYTANATFGSGTPIVIGGNDYYTVYNGTGTTVTVQNLNGSTAYNFKAFEYNTANTCYLSTSPASNDVTTASAASTNTLTLGTGSATISSLVNTQPAEVTAFQWKSTDIGGDGSSSRFSQLIFRPGTGNDITDFTQLILGAELYDDQGNGPSEHGTAVITSNSITIPTINFGGNGSASMGDLGTIVDNNNKTYTLKVWLNPALGGSLPSTVDGLNLVLSLSAVDISVVPGKTGYAPAATANSGATNNAIDVVATKININQQPSAAATANVALATQPIFEATDANNNRDLNINNAITVGVTNAGIGPASALANFTAGIANFTGSGFKFANAGTTKMNVGITSPTITSPNSNDVVVTASTNLGSAAAALASSPLINSSTLNPVLGFSLNTTGSVTNLTDLVFNSTLAPTGYVNSFKLYTNAIDNFSGAAQVATSASLTFSGMSVPIDASLKYFFLVVDVDPYFPSFPANIQFSLPASNFTVASGGNKTGLTQTGTNYSFSDLTSPDVLSITRNGSLVNGWSSTNGTSASVVDFVVKFTEPVLGVNNNDFRIVTDGTVGFGIKSFTGSGDTYTVTVTGVGGTGHLRLEVKDNNSISDNAGNAFRGPGLTDYFTDFNTPNLWYYSIVLPQPSNPALGFTISFEDDIELQTLTTQDILGPQLPTHYLFMARESQGATAFPTIANGSLIPDDLHDFTYAPQSFNGDYSNPSSDGLWVFNTTSASTVNNFFWLFRAGMNYDFIVYPYTKSTNYSDDNVAYGAPSSILNHPIGPLASNSTLNALTSAAPIASTYNTVGNKKQVFAFSVTDGKGTSTGYEYAPTKISNLTIGKDAIDNVSNWAAVISGAELFDVNSPSTSFPATSITGSQIIFTGIPSSVSGDLGYIDPSNNWTGFISTKTFGLRIYLSNASGALTDGQVLAFKVTNTSFGYNSGLGTFIDHQGSSTIQAATATSGAQTIDVTASKLVFTTDLPDKVGLKHPFAISPIVEAWDANNNLDINFNGATISASNGITFSNIPSWVSGKLTFSSFVFNDPGLTQLTVSKAGVTSAVSSSPTGPGGQTDVKISAYTAVAQTGSPSLTIPSITTFAPGVAPSAGQLNATTLSNFSFIVTDDSGVPAAEDDILPTRISSITIRQNTNNGTAVGGATFDDWQNSIAGAELSVGGVNVGGTVTLNNNSIVFGSIPNLGVANLGYIADGTSRTYTLKIYFQNPVNSALRDIFDNEDFVFEITNETDFGLTSIAGNYSSTLSALSTFNSGNGNNTVAVTSTRLDFVNQPPATQSYDVNLTVTPQVKARDANQNLDLGYNSNATLSAVFVPSPPNIVAYAYPLSNSAFTFSSGVVNLSSVAVQSSGNGVNNDVIYFKLDDTPDVGTVASASSTTTTLKYSGNSDIIDAGFTQPQNIQYALANNQVTDITNATGIAVEQFTVRDGGGSADTDGTDTKLSAITLNIDNYQYLRRVALYDGATEVADLPVAAPNITVNSATNADMTFTGITNFIVTDDLTKDLTVKVSFNSANVLDNAVIKFKVISVTAAGVSSSFTPGASTAFPTLAPYENQIEVVATQIDYTNIPANASVYVPITVVAEARDANANRDLDYNGTISSFSTTPGGPTFTTDTPNDPTGAFVNGVKNFPAGFQFISGQGNTQLVLNSGVGSTAGSVNAAAISGTSAVINVLTSSESWVTTQPTYNLPTDIDYVSFQSTNITNSNSAELVQLIVSDGDADGVAGDIDGAATVLNSFTLGIANYTAIRRIAIYDDNDVELQELDASDFVSVGPGPNGPIGSITFGPALGITAADNSFKLFRIRATFFNTSSVIVDNTPIQLSLLGGILGGGSKFYDLPPLSGTYILGNPPANTTAPATANKIEVTATALDFTTQASNYAGINERVGPGYTTSPLPPFTQQPTPSNLPTTTAATVKARDANQLVDLDFNITASAITITDNAGDNLVAPNAFVNGVLNLDGLVYNMVGDGTLKVKANGLDSSTPSIGHTAGGLVNVVNVSVNPAAIVTPPNLKGGTPGAILLGVTFKPDYSTTTEPSLKKFIFSFDFPYQTATTTILKNFKVRQGATDVTTTGATVTPYYSNPSVTTDLDLVIVDWGSNTPVPLYDPNTGNPLAVTFYLIADIDITAKIGTQKLTPQLIDGGNGRPTDANIVTTVGTASAGVIGQQYSFASTRPPVLKTSAVSLTRPYNGQLNVDKNLNHIDLEFDVQVWSLDGTAELYDRTTNIKVADLIATNGNFVTQGGTSTPTANPISFSISWLNGNSFQDDGLYYVTIEKGSFDNLSGTGSGISDDGFNYFGGISSNSILFFKISSPNPPVLSGASGVFSNLSTGVFKTIFDQRGTAYYLVLDHAQYVANGSNNPTNADILSPAAYSLANPSTVVTNGNYVITQVNTAQTESFNGSLTAATAYDVWIFAKNDANPTNISTTAPYGSSANNFSVGGAGPTLKFTTPTISNVRNSFQPDYTLCPDSYVTLTDPIIIGEQNSTDFSAAGLQDFNILLPTGFEFDGVNKPTVQLVGAEFDQTSLLVTWINNTLINISYKNNPSFNSGISTLDKIIITNLRIIGNGGSDPGNIRRFAGNASIGSSANLASISNLSTSQQKFTNSYSVSNDFTPFGFSTGATITAIPDNYVDADASISGAIRLIPQITPANDFGITFFSGNGVTNDVLSLSAVALNSAFDITMTHTDLNGCISENNVQYVVYDHNAPISTKLGSAPIPGSNPPVAGGTQEALVNANFPAQAATVVYPNAALPRINYKDLAGYKLLLLKADLPSNSANQIMSGAAWQNQISKIPVVVNSVTNDTDLPTVLGFTAYNEYQWDYTHILNAVSESSSAIATDPYDNFKFFTSAAKTNTYWTGGSLGKVVFTGTFQNTADLSVLVPFRQEVELFVPPIPAIEVSASPSFDLADPLNPVSASPNGTPVFCEQGGDISIFGFPSASAASSGVFTLVDAQSNTSITIPAGSFTDNGNGTALLKPNLLNNAYNDIKVVYTYKENNSPSTGSSSFIIRVSPNPVANFTTSLLCEDIDVKFTDISSLTPASGVKIDFWKWNFSDNNSPNNSDVAQNPTHKYNDAGLYPAASLSVTTNYNCSSVVPKLIDLNIGGTPTVAFGLTGVSIADAFSFTSASTSSSNDNLAKLDWTFGNGNVLAVSSGFGATVTNGYTSPGPYNVDLKVTSQIGCTNNLTKQIVVLDRAIPTQAAAYLETFESSNGNWQILKAPTSPTPASWAYGVPTTNNIKIDPSTNGAKVWKTGLSGTYNNKEVSGIYSPSFDISQLQRPMISFNTFTQMESGDGVVLEYSTDDKNIADPTKKWDALGQLGEGVDWFTSQGIAAKPGNQPSKDYGWGKIDTVWRESKHTIANDPLDPLKSPIEKQTRVVFRLALASVKDNPTADGFAFDNVRIGERTRTILLENFTTTNGKDNVNNALVKGEDDFLNSFIAGGLGTTVVKLNYHIGFTGVDPFNLDNPADPSARALYYNVKDVPWAFLDGKRSDDASVTPNFSAWGQRAYDTQTLQLAQSQINVSTPIVGADGSIKFDVQVNALYDLPDNTILNVALIEQSVDGSTLSQAQKDLIKTGETSFNYVLKKMLPNAVGTKFGTLLPKGTSRTFSGFEYYPDPSKLYETKDDLAIIVFLQNESGRGIYQTELITGFNDPPVVTGLENIELLEQVEVYPNPSDKEFLIRLPGAAKQAMEIQLIDQVGKMVHKDTLTEGASSKTVSTQDFAAGVYILQIGSGNSGIVRKKVLVVHQD